MICSEAGDDVPKHAILDAIKAHGPLPGLGRAAPGAAPGAPQPTERICQPGADGSEWTQVESTVPGRVRHF